MKPIPFGGGFSGNMQLSGCPSQFCFFYSDQFPEKRKEWTNRILKWRKDYGVNIKKGLPGFPTPGK
jgi:hypothetical protein